MKQKKQKSSDNGTSSKIQLNYINVTEINRVFKDDQSSKTEKRNLNGRSFMEKKTDLRDLAGIINTALASLSKDQTVSMESLGRLCEEIECNLEDIVEYKREGLIDSHCQ